MNLRHLSHRCFFNPLQESAAKWLILCGFASMLSIGVGQANAQTPNSDAKTSAQSGPNSYQISERALQIHQRGYVFDGHNDLPWEIRTKTTKHFDELDIAKPQPQLHTDIDRLRAGNLGAQFWSVYVPVETIAAGNAFQTTKEQIDLVHKMIARYPDVFELALDGEDVQRIQSSGKIASLIGMEGGHSIEGSIGKLHSSIRWGLAI